MGYLILMTFPVAMAFAAANDLLTMKIPNWISLAVIGGFAAAAIASRMPLETLGVHIALAVVVLAATFWLFSMNMLGGGDAKLMAAGALWMGVDHIVEYVAFITIYGGVLALIIMAYRRVPAGAVAVDGAACHGPRPGRVRGPPVEVGAVEHGDQVRVAVRVRRRWSARP